MSPPSSPEDHLFEVPLGEFTDARNQCARELTKNKETDLAQRVKQLKKPKPSAWAVNQLARKHKAALKALFSVSDALRAPTQWNRGDKLKTQANNFREQLKSLQGTARALLESSGITASDKTLEEISDTLRGACADDGLRVEVMEGRLTEPLQGDFGFLMAASGPPADLPEPRTQVAPPVRINARTSANEDKEKPSTRTEVAREEAARAKAAENKALERRHLEQKVHRLKKDLSLAQSRMDSAQRQLQDVQALYKKAVDALQALEDSP